MQRTRFIILFFLLFIIPAAKIFAQDTAIISNEQMHVTIGKDKAFKQALTVDTLHKFDPRKATIRSAIIPGWGQAYNKQYWKIPIVYGALITTGAIFAYNVKYYRKLRLAYTIRASNDSAAFPQIDPTLQPLSTEALQSYRDIFRQNIDYSALFFLFFWGLNVVDATVDAHLKEFDIGNNLSFRIKAGYSPMANTNGLSFVLNFDRKHE